MKLKFVCSDRAADVFFFSQDARIDCSLQGWSEEMYSFAACRFRLIHGYISLLHYLINVVLFTCEHSDSDACGTQTLVTPASR